MPLAPETAQFTNDRLVEASRPSRLGEIFREADRQLAEAGALSPVFTNASTEPARVISMQDIDRVAQVMDEVAGVVEVVNQAHAAIPNRVTGVIGGFGLNAVGQNAVWESVQLPSGVLAGKTTFCPESFRIEPDGRWTADGRDITDDAAAIRTAVIKWLRGMYPSCDFPEIHG